MTTRMFLIVIVGVWASLQVAGQDILYYKFESGSGRTEINYGDPTPGVPRLGRSSRTRPCCRRKHGAPGSSAAGLALRPVTPAAGVEFDTGWDNVVGEGVDVTIAFFFKAVYPLPSNRGRQFCAPGFRRRRHPYGHQRRSVHLRATEPELELQRRERRGGELGAGRLDSCVLELGSSRRGRDPERSIQLPDGDGPMVCQRRAQIPQTSTQCWHNIAGTSLHTFRFGQVSEAYFRYDEMRVCLRAVPAAEILQWATTDLAADAPYGDACYPFGLPVLLNGSGGNPTPGNSAYMLTVYGLPGSNVYLGFGLSDTSWGATPLPLDLAIVNPGLAGCLFRASPDALATGTIGAAGSLVFPFPIPTSPSPLGANAYAQAILYSPVTGLWSSTNAWAVHVGN